MIPVIEVCRLRELFVSLHPQNTTSESVLSIHVVKILGVTTD